MSQFLFALVNGLTVGMAVFLVAAGVTLMFGVLKILNFAHGSFFMIGAYVAFTVVGEQPPSPGLYVGAALVAGAVVGGLGLVADLAVLRRLRHYDEGLTLIATFALLMFCDGLVKLVWGVEFYTVNLPQALSGNVKVGTLSLPSYSLFIIVLGVLVFAALDAVLHRLWLGKIVQSVAADAWMSAAVGVNVRLVMTCAVIAAFFLVGVAGGLLLPNQSLSPTLSHTYLLYAFVVVVIGGLGNVRGAFIASVLLSLIESLNAFLLPAWPGIAIYVAMVVCLVWRPDGLLAPPGGLPAHGPAPAAGGAAFAAPLAVGTKGALAVIVVAALATAPLWAGPGLLFVLGVTLVEALFALSWNLLFGYAGLAAFGHAAFMAIGAYCTAYLLKSAAPLNFVVILAAATAAGAAVAGLVGLVALRRTAGIGLAILTMALAEVLRIFIGYSKPLGMDDGLSAIPRPVLDLGVASIGLQSGPRYYLFLCAVCLLAALALWWLTLSRFGRVLRCIRQDAQRTEFLGAHIGRYRLVAFAVSGAFAALAGALVAPWTQIVTPESASAFRSLQPMLNTLLGGADFFWGPAVGAALFAALAYATRSLAGVSEVVTGAVLLLIVLGAPTGVLGILSRWRTPRPPAQSPPARAEGLARSPVKGAAG